MGNGQHWKDSLRGSRWAVWKADSREFVVGLDEVGSRIGLGNGIAWTSRAEADRTALAVRGTVIDADEFMARGSEYLAWLGLLRFQS